MADKDVARKLLDTLQAENPKASSAEIAQLYADEVYAALASGEREAVLALIDGPVSEWLWAVLDARNRALADRFPSHRRPLSSKRR